MLDLEPAHLVDLRRRELLQTAADGAGTGEFVVCLGWHHLSRLVVEIQTLNQCPEPLTQAFEQLSSRRLSLSRSLTMRARNAGSTFVADT